MSFEIEEDLGEFMFKLITDEDYFTRAVDHFDIYLETAAKFPEHEEALEALHGARYIVSEYPGALLADTVVEEGPSLKLAALLYLISYEQSLTSSEIEEICNVAPEGWVIIWGFESEIGYAVYESEDIPIGIHNINPLEEVEHATEEIGFLRDLLASPVPVTMYKNCKRVENLNLYFVISTPSVEEKSK